MYCAENYLEGRKKTMKNLHQYYSYDSSWLSPEYKWSASLLR